MTGHKQKEAVRLFLGIPASPNWKRFYLEFQAGQRLRDARWTAERNLHATVLFIGSFPASLLEGLTATVAREVNGSRSFCLDYRDCHYVPPKNPKMVWIRFFENNAFTGLATNLLSTLSRQFGDQLSGKLSLRDPVIPHITVARLQQPGKAQPALIVPKTPPRSLDVGSVVLYRSVLHPEGVRYSKLWEFSLEG